MEMYVCEIFDAYGLESTKTDMQRHMMDVDTGGMKLFQHLGREMEAGSRRCSRTLLLIVAKDCLISRSIIKRVFAVHIRRQRHVSDALDDAEKVSLRLKSEDALAELTNTFNMC